MNPIIKLILFQTLIVFLQAVVIRLCNKDEKINYGDQMPYLFCVPVFILFPVFVYMWNVSFCSILVYTQIAIIIVLALVEFPSPMRSTRHKIGTVPVVFRANMLILITTTIICKGVSWKIKATSTIFLVCLMVIVYTQEDFLERESENGFALFLLSFCFAALMYVCFADIILHTIMSV